MQFCTVSYETIQFQLDFETSGVPAYGSVLCLGGFVLRVTLYYGGHALRGRLPRILDCSCAATRRWPRMYLVVLGWVVILPLLKFIYRCKGKHHYAVYDVLFALQNVGLHTWLIRLMLQAGTPPVLDGKLMRRIILGWGVNQAFWGAARVYGWIVGFQHDYFVPSFRTLVWTLGVGTWLMTEDASTNGVAFWAAAGLLGNTVMSCANNWVQARLDGSLK